MQSTYSIIPLLIGFLISLGIHITLLSTGNTERNALPQLDRGRTVVQLTLMPSRAAKPSDPKPAENAEKSPRTLDPEPKPKPEFRQPEEKPEEQRNPAAKKQNETEEKQSPESREINASPEEIKGVTRKAQSLSKIRPRYPRISRKRNEEGTVTLKAHVTSEGRCEHAVILETSGHHRLDEAALEAVYKASFSPAMKNGRAIDVDLELSFTFRLTHE